MEHAKQKELNQFLTQQKEEAEARRAEAKRNSKVAVSENVGRAHPVEQMLDLDEEHRMKRTLKHALDEQVNNRNTGFAFSGKCFLQALLASFFPPSPFASRRFLPPAKSEIRRMLHTRMRALSPPSLPFVRQVMIKTKMDAEAHMREQEREKFLLDCLMREGAADAQAKLMKKTKDRQELQGDWDKQHTMAVASNKLMGKIF